MNSCLPVWPCSCSYIFAKSPEIQLIIGFFMLGEKETSLESYYRKITYLAIRLFLIHTLSFNFCKKSLIFGYVKGHLN